MSEAMDRLWAGWRLPYVTTEELKQTAVGYDADRTLFEGIEQSGRPDEETRIVWRGPTCFAVMNAFPYTSGHLMVLPKRAVAEVEDLTAEEHSELFAAVRDAIVALKAAYAPDGINVGINLGRGAGAGVPDHLHVHVLPRWSGDTNFMTAVAEARVLPESLDASWAKVAAAWPR